jgi:tripartite-type tricarboxylate transporter receptor subunit TctC
MKSFLRCIGLLLTAWMLVVAVKGALAQDYPSKPIRIIVPYPAGGFNDTLGRVLANKLREAWGQPAIVENRPGGGTIIGTELAAKAAPDGYTLLINSVPFAVNPSLYRKLPYDAAKDFVPVILAADAPNLLVVNPSSSLFIRSRI